MRHSHSHVHSKNMHERTHGPARAHALTRNIPTRTCATPRSTYTRHSTFENRQPSPHTHVHSKNLHARTHGRAHSHARTHEIIHVHGDTHTARTRNIRTRKCATPGSIRILGIRRAKTDNPHGTLPPCLTFLIYHRRLHMFSRVVGTGALVCIATPPLGSPATRWPTMHLRHATHKGWRNARVRDSAPQRAPRLHMLSRVGRHLCAGPGRHISG